MFSIDCSWFGFVHTNTSRCSQCYGVLFVEAPDSFLAIIQSHIHLDIFGVFNLLYHSFAAAFSLEMFLTHDLICTSQTASKLLAFIHPVAERICGCASSFNALNIVSVKLVYACSVLAPKCS